ncbi:MAG: hypothetical protein GY719_24410 [bacterium]|nr:hypothetical protein [bacterium]
MYAMSFNSRVLRLGLLLVLVTVLAVSSPVLVEALCAAQQEDGNWTNVDPNTRGLTRANLRFVCQDLVLNGQLYPPGPPWYVHLYGKCHPTDCDWGEVGARRLESGYVYAEYDQGFAKRYVYARMSRVRPGQLWVWMWTDFRDPGRRDYASSNYFNRS